MAKSSHLPMLIVLYASSFVAAFNENLVNVALVDISQAYEIGYTTAQWLVTGYMIVTCVIVAVMAFLLQRFTLRKLYFFAFACFIIGEGVCMIAPAFPLLLVARLLQAVGSGVFIPIMMTTVLALAPRERMGTLLAIGGACITLGPAFAPVISGALTTLFGWRAIFAAPALASIVCALAGLKTFVNYREVGPAKLDIPSLVWATLGLTLTVFGLSELLSNTAIALACLAIGIVALALFARRQLRIEHPMLNLQPMAKPRFAVAVALALITMMMSFSTGVVLPMYLESAFGFSALMAGVVLLPAIIFAAISSIAGGRIMDAFGPWPLLAISYGITTIGQIAITLCGNGIALAGVIAGAIAVYVGTGASMAPTQTAGLQILPGDQHPDGVSIMSVILMVAGSVGPSLFIGVMSAGEHAALLAGASARNAAASGFTHAIIVAAIIAFVGFAIAAVYSWRCRKR